MGLTLDMLSGSKLQFAVFEFVIRRFTLAMLVDLRDP